VGRIAEERKASTASRPRGIRRLAQVACLLLAGAATGMVIGSVIEQHWRASPGRLATHSNGM
jgi:hypothetical protein